MHHLEFIERGRENKSALRLRAAGVDGVQVNFYDFGSDLDRFARTVLPLMHEAGRRNPEPAGHDMGSAA